MRENDGSAYGSAWEACLPFTIFGCSRLKCDQFSKFSKLKLVHMGNRTRSSDKDTQDIQGFHSKLDASKKASGPFY